MYRFAKIATICGTLTALTALTACVTPTQPTTSAPAPTPSTQAGTHTGTQASNTNGISVSRYRNVVARMEPIAESACRTRVRTGVNCDFKIVLDQDPSKPSNAYQSQEASGRPVLTFTVAILQDMRNEDEVAFVLGHEAAHHIQGHLTQTRETATIGALAGGALAVLLGGGQAAVDIGSNLGGTVGARAYSKDHELQADSLGARIAHNAGYNALRGAEFFNRIPDPGDRFLGSHPPNADRIATVRRTVASF